jgi:phosphohistidine phosphatase SixA
MRVFVVRHGCAGDKGSWPGQDAERPLDGAGVRQAAALADALSSAGVGVRRIATSPTRRCRDTVVPLARRLGLPVEELEALLPARTDTELLALVTNAAARDAVFCTHGETMRPALAAIRARGVPIDARLTDDLLLAKGTAWVLAVDEPGTIVGLDHLVPGSFLDCQVHGQASQQE